MKKFFLIILQLSLSLSLFSQTSFVDKENNSNPSTYGIFSAGYEAIFTNDDFSALNGFNLEALYGVKLGNCPVYLESGLGITYATALQQVSSSTYSLSENKPIPINVGARMTNLSIYLPINIGYKFPIRDNSGIYPFTGINLKGNPSFDYFLNYQDEYVKLRQVADSKLFQMGWQIGVKFFIKKFYIGLQYSIDFLPKANILTEITPAEEFAHYLDYKLEDNFKLRTSQLSVNLGIFLK